MHFTVLFIPMLNILQRAQAKKIACDGLIFHQVYYDKEVLFTKIGKPYNLVYHKFSGTLFFSHTVEESMHVDFAIRACHIDSKKCIDVGGIEGGYAIAYDLMNDDIYFGGHNGIYQYNFLTKQAEYFDERGKSIWALFIRKNFYYIEYPGQKLYVYRDSGFVEVAEAIGIEIDHFHVSRSNQIYFSNKTAVFKVLTGRYTAVLSDDVVVKQIGEDNYGEIYFACSDGIYLEDKLDVGISKVASIDQCFGLTFDTNDYVIYSDKNSINRLAPSNHSELCYNAIISAESEKRKTTRSFPAQESSDDDIDTLLNSTAR